MRGDRTARRSSFGKTIRKRLSDITNYQPEPKSPLVFDPHNELSFSTKERIDHLLKENAKLMELIAEKNKVIEMNRVELQKLQVVVPKMQLQNLKLAQSNSHMMAELNLCKHKLKALQHQLSCKDVLLESMKLELQATPSERRIETNDRNDGSLLTKNADTRDIRDQKVNRRMHPARTTGALMTTFHHVPEKDTVQNKRICVRRQSAIKLRSQEHESKEDLFEIKDLKLHEDGPSSKLTEQVCSSKPGPRESQRMSIGRPLRRAAGKIGSYKETPLNVKMRRPE